MAIILICTLIVYSIGITIAYFNAKDEWDYWHGAFNRLRDMLDEDS